MTRDKMLRIVGIALQSCQGKPLSDQASDVVRSIEIALALEEGDEGALAPIPFPIPGVFEPRIPSSPAVQETKPLTVIPVEPRKILLPSEVSGAVRPIKPLAPPRPARETNPDTKWWTYETLIKTLEERTPERMEITPAGMEKTVVLDRNIEAGVGFDIVKLSYTCTALKASVPDEMDGPTVDWHRPRSEKAETEISPMALDLPVFEIFSLTDRDLNVDLRVQRLKDLAALVYAPKSKDIVSSTPILVGHSLRFDSKNPHDDA